MLRAISLVTVLAVFWLLMSGHFEAWLLIIGAFCCAAVAAISYRMESIDHEGHPVHLAWRGMLYWPWLIVEIFKSGIDVTRVVLQPRMPIHPALIKVKASQSSDLGRMIYANSITLTPGTMTVDMDGDTLTIHALTKDTAAGLMTGDMDDKVTRFVGEEA